MARECRSSIRVRRANRSVEVDARVLHALRAHLPHAPLAFDVSPPLMDLRRFLLLFLAALTVFACVQLHAAESVPNTLPEAFAALDKELSAADRVSFQRTPCANMTCCTYPR